MIGDSRLLMWVVAAAFLVVVSPSLAETLVVDNSDAGFTVLSGAAWTSLTAPGHWLTDYVSQSTSASAGEIEWRPDIVVAGEYDVAVWIPSTGTDRPSDAHYTVQHALGATDVYVDQAAHEVQWVTLGSFVFDAGTGGAVTLSSDAQGDTEIVADAVRFTTGPQASPEFRGFWASSAHAYGLHDLDQIDDMVSRAMQGNYNVINALLMYKQDTGGSLHGALWNSSILPKAPAYPGDTDPLAHLIERAHANGLKVHGRLIPYIASVAWPPTGNTILTAHPEWLCVSLSDMGTGPATIEGLYYLDPGSPEVQEYLISIVRELVTNYEIDGIHWDFIRHLRGDAGYPSDTSYSDSGLARFQQFTGRSDIPPASGDSLWDNYRRRTVGELVRRARAEIASISNPAQPISITAAVVSWGAVPTTFSTSSAWGVFQNWAEWMQLGWLDGACPMNYRADHEPASYDAYRGWVHKALEWRFDRHMYGGQCLYRNSMANNIAQLEYALNAGDEGTISFAYAVTVDSDLDGVPETDWSWYPYVAANLFTEPALTPEMPWRGPDAVEGTLWGRITDGITGEPVDDATVTVPGVYQAKTDGNGYYVVTMIPATGAGTDYAVGVSHLGYMSTSDIATVIAGDVVRLDLALDTPLVPEIVDVTPDPDETRSDYEYVRQLSLTQGTAQPWTLVAGPPGATVTARGRVIGWVPTAADDGQLFDFTVRAENTAGTDEESWQVLVTAPPPCAPMMLADFEGYSPGTSVMFQHPRYSGSTYDDLELSPNVCEVTDQVSAFSDSNVCKVEWQYLDTDPKRWMRLTTHDAANTPNPTVRLDHLIRVRLRFDAGSLRLAVGIRETGTDADVGDDGGTAGTIEWVGAASDIDGAPQGVLLEPMPGVWQTIIFDPLSDPIHGMNGDGELTSYTGKAVLEHLAFTIADTVGPFTVYIDDIELLCDPPTTVPDIIVESRDSNGDVTPPPSYIEDGSWMNSTIKSAVDGLVGVGSRFINYELPNSGTDSATFVPDILVPGRYEVFVTWANGANCYDALYTVRDPLGITTQLVDQIASGAPEPANYDEWISLGRYWFDAGQDLARGSISVSEETVTGRPADGWGYRVYADALRLEFAEPWPDGDYTGDGRLDADDYVYWQDCMTAPAVEHGGPRCHVFDFDLDADIDLRDLVTFQRAFANTP